MESEDYWIICWMQSIQWNLVISIKTRLSQAACRSGIKCGQPRRAARCRASSRPPLAIVISYFWNCEKLCDCMSWGSCRGEGRGQSVESSQPKPYQILFTIHMPPPCQALQMVTLVSGRRRHRISSQTPGMKKCWGHRECHRILIFHKNQECHWFSRKFPSIMFSQEEVFKDLFKRPSSHQP